MMRTVMLFLALLMAVAHGGMCENTNFVNALDPITQQLSYVDLWEDPSNAAPPQRSWIGTLCNKTNKTPRGSYVCTSLTAYFVAYWFPDVNGVLVCNGTYDVVEYSDVPVVGQPYHATLRSSVAPSNRLFINMDCDPTTNGQVVFQAPVSVSGNNITLQWHFSGCCSLTNAPGTGTLNGPSSSNGSKTTAIVIGVVVSVLGVALICAIAGVIYWKNKYGSLFAKKEPASTKAKLSQMNVD